MKRYAEQFGRIEAYGGFEPLLCFGEGGRRGTKDLDGVALRNAPAALLATNKENSGWMK